jgi:transposase
MVIISTGKGKDGSKNRGLLICLNEHLIIQMTKCIYTLLSKENRKKTVVDFLKRLDKRYDKTIQSILLGLINNLSVHKLKKAKEQILNPCLRIKFVFLPIKSPELNLYQLT